MDKHQFIDVSQVDETSDIHEVNRLLELGWKLLKVRNEKESENEFTVFVLGLPRSISGSATTAEPDSALKTD